MEQCKERKRDREQTAGGSLRITRLFIITGHGSEGGCRVDCDGPYLVCIKLSFLDKPGRHVLGLGLLLGWVVLVLTVEMLILSLLPSGKKYI